MTKGLRATLWILSSLAVLWTVLTVVGLVRMGMMMAGGMMRGDMGGMMSGGGMTVGPMTMGTILYCALTVLVMLGLDGVFVYLVATSRRPTGTQATLHERRAA